MPDQSLVDLLRELRPKLVYDREERFFADGPATFVENTFAEGPSDAYATRLLRSEGDEVIASANHAQADRLLTVDYLRTDAYPSGDVVLDDDYLEAGVEWVADARRAHAAGTSANQIFGRVAPSSRGGHWLQYWFFYFASVKGIPSIRSASGPLGVGLHPADWEMIQLRVPDEARTATEATFAAHNYAFAVDPALEDWKDGVPCVFIGLGSHASYPRPGVWRNLSEPGFSLWSRLDDRCIPGPFASRPPLDVIGEDEPSWVSWPGRWGHGGPRSPGCQDQWKDPDLLHEGAHDLSEGLRRETREEAGVTLPSELAVHVARDGRTVTISFDVPIALEDSWAAMLTLALDPPDQDLPVQLAYDVTEPGVHQPLLA